MTGYENRDRFPSARTGQEGDDDTPLSDLKWLEMIIKGKWETMPDQLEPVVSSLGRQGVDVDLKEMAKALDDVVSDYLGLEMMRLENME